MQKNNTRRLTESAIMVALAAVLAMVKVWEMPLGGSVTAACMAPIIFIALRYGAKWGLLTGLVFAVIQMIEGFWAPPVRTLLWFFLVVMLDYVLPFGLLGLAPPGGPPVQKRRGGRRCGHGGRVRHPVSVPLPLGHHHLAHRRSRCARLGLVSHL